MLYVDTDVSCRVSPGSGELHFEICYTVLTYWNCKFLWLHIDQKFKMPPAHFCLMGMRRGGGGGGSSYIQFGISVPLHFPRYKNVPPTQTNFNSLHGKIYFTCIYTCRGLGRPRRLQVFEAVWIFRQSTREVGKIVIPVNATHRPPLPFMKDPW
jgi:hypothetical protein